jgi:hypothetical protein
MRAKKVEIIQKEIRPKILISGKSGTGKTMFALGFPGVYFIDVEGGAVRRQYQQKLVDNGGVYMGKEDGSQDFKTVLEEVKMLATTKHDYKTLVIDSFSKLYNIASSIAEEKLGSDFGRDKKEANRPTRQLMRLFDSLDMTVLLVCHLRDKWERKGSDITYSGTTFDGYDKLEYDLDLWIEAQKAGNTRTYVVKKSRIDSFPEGDRFPLDYSTFSNIYGASIIEKESTPIILASPEQVEKLEKLVKIINLDPEIIQKWLSKAEAESFEEMTSETINKCIAYVETQLQAATSTAVSPSSNGKGKREVLA